MVWKMNLFLDFIWRMIPIKHCPSINSVSNFEGLLEEILWEAGQNWFLDCTRHL